MLVDTDVLERWLPNYFLGVEMIKIRQEQSCSIHERPFDVPQGLLHRLYWRIRTNLSVCSFSLVLRPAYFGPASQTYIARISSTDDTECSRGIVERWQYGQEVKLPDQQCQHDAELHIRYPATPAAS